MIRSVSVVSVKMIYSSEMFISASYDNLFLCMDHALHTLTHTSYK